MRRIARVRCDECRVVGGPHWSRKRRVAGRTCSHRSSRGQWCRPARSPSCALAPLIAGWPGISPHPEHWLAVGKEGPFTEIVNSISCKQGQSLVWMMLCLSLAGHIAVLLQAVWTVMYTWRHSNTTVCSYISTLIWADLDTHSGYKRGETTIGATRGVGVANEGLVQ